MGLNLKQPIQCAQCKTIDITNLSHYYNKKADGYLGEWPLYFFGAGPHNPAEAEFYFCGPHCATLFCQRTRDAT